MITFYQKFELFDLRIYQTKFVCSFIQKLKGNLLAMFDFVNNKINGLFEIILILLLRLYYS